MTCPPHLLPWCGHEPHLPSALLPELELALGEGDE